MTVIATYECDCFAATPAHCTRPYVDTDSQNRRLGLVAKSWQRNASGRVGRWRTLRGLLAAIKAQLQERGGA
jgi:hypothetical protein